MKNYLAHPATHIAKPRKAAAQATACQRVWLPNWRKEKFKKMPHCTRGH